jgi:hypothetical protein
MKNLIPIAAILICQFFVVNAIASHTSGQSFVLNPTSSHISGEWYTDGTRQEKYIADRAKCDRQRANTPGICTLQFPSGSGDGRKGGKKHLVCRPGGMPAYHKCIHEANVEYSNPQPDS